MVTSPYLEHQETKNCGTKQQHPLVTLEEVRFLITLVKDFTLRNGRLKKVEITALLS